MRQVLFLACVLPLAAQQGVNFYSIEKEIALGNQLAAEFQRNTTVTSDARVEKLGWHIVVYFEMPDLPELEDFFTALPTTVVVDHMGTPDVKKGVDHPENQRFHRLMDKHKNFWVKVTCPERMSLAGPPYDDVVPFGHALVEHFPDRVIWGTDWPHPNMKKQAPDDGVLVDYVPKVATTAAAQQRLLVDNPMRLYWA